MGRARGANAAMHTNFEAIYGTPPATGWRKVPFVSCDLGAERGLIESDLLGQGRRPFDPTPDVTNNDGNVVVPVDEEFFGHWLKLLLGSPVTTPTADLFQHVFDVGAPALPSQSIEIAHPDVPSYSTNYGVCANTMQINAQRSGLLNATFGLIAKGETAPAATTATDAPTGIATITRLSQMSGSFSMDAAPLGSIVSAALNFSNGLDKVETIRPDGEIEGADPSMPSVSGELTIRYATLALAQRAVANTPCSLQMQWQTPKALLAIQMDRIFLPQRKKMISGPAGVQVKYDFMASGEGSDMFRVLLTNSKAAY